MELVDDAPLWVAWQKMPGEGRVPISPGSGRACGVRTPTGWGTRENARQRAKQLREQLAPAGGDSGIGTVLGPLPGFPGLFLSGVDLDGCRDAETGDIQPWAEVLLDRFDSYAEVSPSGEGIHILFVCSDDDRLALKAEGLILEGSEFGRDFRPHKGCEIAPRLCGGKWYSFTGHSIAPPDIAEVLGDGVPWPVQRVTLADLRWLFAEHGPQFMEKLQRQTGSPTRGGDQSGELAPV